MRAKSLFFRASVSGVLWAASVAASAQTGTWTPTSLQNAPRLRGDHTAVWTGSRMIVWGGFYPSSFYENTGGIYNPASDTWVPLSTTNAPSARSSHTAVWTGSRMIVWGGWGGDTGGYVDTGGVYDPATDTWSPMSTTNAPSARGDHTAVWTGSRMVVWGGYGDSVYMSSGGVYDPTSNTWAAIGTIDAPSARSSHTAVWTGSRMIVWGGREGVSDVNTGGVYDPTSDGWVPIGTIDAPSARSSHTAIWTGSRMIVWGGSSPNTGGTYDPASDTWAATSTTNAPSARNGHTAVWTGSRMIVWGGNVNTGGVYDPASDTWVATSTTNAPSARNGHTAVWTGSRMIVWGSYYSGGSTGGVFDPLTETATLFHAVSPCRVFDSRDASLGGPNPRLGGSETTVLFAGRCGLPAAAKSVSINITATQPLASGFLTLHSMGSPRPVVSVLNFSATQTRANNAVAPLGSTGDLMLFSWLGSGSVHVIIDVNGYFE